MRYNTRPAAAPFINETLHRAAIAEAGAAGRIPGESSLQPEIIEALAETGEDIELFMLDLDSLDSPSAYLG